MSLPTPEATALQLTMIAKMSKLRDDLESDTSGTVSLEDDVRSIENYMNKEAKFRCLAELEAVISQRYCIK